MTWQPNSGIDTCKSNAMWSIFCPEPQPPLNRTQRVSSSSSSSLRFRLISRSMEEDLRRSIQSPPPLSSDPESLPELTPTSSDSSAITLDNTSKDFSHHYAAVSFPDQSTRWTDQQHNLYLSSLEASFVNELHRSMRLRGWSLQNNTDEAYKCRTLKNSRNMPKQSLAIQDGCRKKISLERIAPILESTADSHVLAGITSVERGCSLRESNTYDHDLLCDEEIQARGSGTLSNSSPRSLEKQRICCSFHLESVFSTTEVSDQNFKDEVARSCCMPVAKRLKTAAADASSSDHLLPFGKFHTTDISTSSNSISEDKGHELLSELPESFHFPKSDLPYFLRGK